MNLLSLGDPHVSAWCRAHLGGEFPARSSLTLGVRPEAMRLADAGVPAEVVGFEYLGADSLITCRINSSECIVRQSGKVRLAAGDRIHVAWPAAEAHFFESETGLRLKS
jgi:sn-glycerol 3-phosphate transport system ATP-binding protein